VSPATRPFRCFGDPDEVADTFAKLAEAGLDGMAFSLVNYLDDFPIVRDEVLPRLVANWAGGATQGEREAGLLRRPEGALDSSPQHVRVVRVFLTHHSSASYLTAEHSPLQTIWPVDAVSRATTWIDQCARSVGGKVLFPLTVTDE